LSFIIVVVYCLAYAICNVSGAALIKMQLQETSPVEFQDYIWFMLKPRVIAGFAVVFLSSMILIKALSLSKISLINSMSTGMNYSLTLIMGYFLFQDRLTLVHYIGIVLILVGVFVITLAERA
jgi:multidrug transporter EmrE-like cation transporter